MPTWAVVVLEVPEIEALSINDTAVTELPLMVPCANTSSPIAILEVVLVVPAFVILALLTSIVYETLLLFVIVIVLLPCHQ
jgi:hypothetical protein